MQQDLAKNPIVKDLSEIIFLVQYGLMWQGFMRPEEREFYVKTEEQWFSNGKD